MHETQGCDETCVGENFTYLISDSSSDASPVVSTTRCKNGALEGAHQSGELSEYIEHCVNIKDDSFTPCKDFPFPRLRIFNQSQVMTVKANTANDSHQVATSIS